MLKRYVTIRGSSYRCSSAGFPSSAQALTRALQVSQAIGESLTMEHMQAMVHMPIAEAAGNVFLGRTYFKTTTRKVRRTTVQLPARPRPDPRPPFAPLP